MEDKKQPFSKALLVARLEYRKWIINPKMILLAVFLIFARTLIIAPLLEHSMKYGERINSFEPFIAMGNSGFLTLLIPMIYLVLLGDFPMVEANSLFYISRAGKRNWLWGQILFMLGAVVTIMGIILVGSIVMSHGELSWSWSNVVTKYGTRFPDERESFGCTILPSNLYNQMCLKNAFMYTIIFQILQLVVMSLILCVGKIYKGGMLGFAMGIAVLGVGIVSTSVKAKVMWIFPMAHTIVWLHYPEILSEQIFPISYSFLVYVVMIVLLIYACFEGIGRMKFEAINGE